MSKKPQHNNVNQLCVIFKARKMVMGPTGTTFFILHMAFLVPATLNIAEQSFHITHQKSHHLFSPWYAKAENAESPVKQRVCETLWTSL